LLPGASMSVDVLPRSFYFVLIAGRKMQFVFGVAIVMRPEKIGILRTHLPHSFRAIVLWRFNGLFKYDLIAVQRERHPCSKIPGLELECSEIEEVSVNIIQTEQFVLERKDTVGAVANDFYVCIIAAGQRDPHHAHEHIGISADPAA
jgi:hypothetical protein